MQISLTIYSDPPARDFSKPKSHQWYRKGDIINVQMWHGEPLGAPRFVFVHVVDIPEPRPVEQLFERLYTLLMSTLFEQIGEERVLLRRRKWRLVFSRMPAAQQTALRDDRNITLTWRQLKVLLRTKTIHDNIDPSQDTGKIAIEDSDL